MYEARDYETRIWWSQEDGVFVAQTVELPGIMAHGDSRAEAASNIQIALEAALEWMRESGDVLPAPAHRLAA